MKKVKSYYSYWKDKDNNRWSKSKYSQEEAQACSELLINCSNCIDCEESSDCKNCRECKRCISLRYCTRCYDCRNCIYCEDDKSIKYCTECYNCVNCSNCGDCDECFNLNNRSYYRNNHKKGEQLDD